MARPNIRDIEEAVFVLMLFVDTAHKCSRWGQDLINEDEDSLLGRELDTLADDVDELADCEVCRHQILLLVDGSDIRLLDLFADNLCGRKQVSHRNER